MTRPRGQASVLRMGRGACRWPLRHARSRARRRGSRPLRRRQPLPRFRRRARRLLSLRRTPARSARRRAARGAHRSDPAAAGLDAARRRFAGTDRRRARAPRIGASSPTAASTGGAVAAAVWQRLRGGPPRGASTISMQVAALLDADLHRGARRARLREKWRQMRAAWALERAWTKAADPRGVSQPRHLPRRAAGHRRGRPACSSTRRRTG